MIKPPAAAAHPFHGSGHPDFPGPDAQALSKSAKMAESTPNLKFSVPFASDCLALGSYLPSCTTSKKAEI
jgi:hypothetical protein